MLREFTEKPEGYEINLYSRLFNLIVRVVRLLHIEQGPAGGVLNSRNGRSEILRILEGIPYRIADSLTVESLAAESGMSTRNFIRLFRKVTGMGFSNYLQHKRIEQACQLLHESDFKIAYIAKCVGYRDITHFRETFRKIIGVNPNSFRATKEDLNRHLSNER